MPLRLALVGESGVGTSTLARALSTAATTRGERMAVVSLQPPVRRLVTAVYAEAGLAPPVQDELRDRALRSDLLAHLRRRRPDALAERVLDEISTYPDEVGVCVEDLQYPLDARHLRAAGFTVVALSCPEPLRRQRLAQRDETPLLTTPRLRWEQIPVDRDVQTTTPAGELAEELLAELRDAQHFAPR